MVGSVDRPISVERVRVREQMLSTTLAGLVGTCTLSTAGGTSAPLRARHKRLCVFQLHLPHLYAQVKVCTFLLWQ